MKQETQEQPVAPAGPQNLLAYTVIVEPDRQRLARFAMNAVEVLGGNIFSSAGVLEKLLRQLRNDGLQSQLPIEVRLQLEDLVLYLTWRERREKLTTLTQLPSPEGIKALAQRLKNASESADTTLLKRRNEQIIADLEGAKERARLEMKELETLLELKKRELNKSIIAAQTDALTGLFNRSGYDTRLEEAFLRCKHQGEPLCLMFLDLDFFKEVNDTRGHQYGDEYLKKMAVAMRASIREHVDHACRMGGDEFAVILYSEMPIARRVAGEILDLMEHKVSIGIAQMREKENIESLVGRTDKVLYEAKNHGRGRFVTDEVKGHQLKVV